MTSQLNPYLHFRGNARQAMEFYKTVFGGNVTMSTFKEYQMSDDPVAGNQIMHSAIQAPNGISFFASDTPEHMEYQPGGTVTMSLTGDNEAELQSYFEKLSKGGTVTVLLAASPWGDKFGMCVDPYGIEWMVNITMPKA